MAEVGARATDLARASEPRPGGSQRASPIVLAIADVESNAKALAEHVLKPAGIRASTDTEQGLAPDVLVVDVTQLRGDPLGALRARREMGEDAPAIILAAHIPASRLRDLLRLGVRDILLKPYRPAELCEAIYELSESRTTDPTVRILAKRLEAARERSRRYADEIALLGEIGRAVATVGDLDMILTRVAEAACYMTNAEETNIYLVEPRSNELILRATKHAKEKHAALHRLRVNDTLAGQVFRTGKPVLHQPSAEGSPVKVQTGFLVQSLVMVPLRIRDRVVGVLGVYNPVQSRPFDDHHLTLLVSLADWASVALEHASLMHQALNAPPSASQMPEQISVAPPLILEGLDKAIAALEPLLMGNLGFLSETQGKSIRAVQGALKQLRGLPIAVLDADLVRSFVDLPRLVEQAVEAMQQEATRKGLTLISESAPTMPIFPGDGDRIRQVISGLVAIAIRRTSQGGVVLKPSRFAVRQGRPDRQLPLPPSVQLNDGLWGMVTVIDTSAGLSPDSELTATAPTTDLEDGTTGPGLSMGEIRMIAESLGGYLWREHAPSGATISFAIPVS